MVREPDSASDGLRTRLSLAAVAGRLLQPAVLTAVGVGGAIGALARYRMELLLPASSRAFPVATFAVNVVGAIILGSLSAISARRLSLTSWVRALVGVGFCGGLTTFSTMSLETAKLWGITPLTAVGYIAVSVIAAPAAIVLGRQFGTRIFPEPSE